LARLPGGNNLDATHEKSSSHVAVINRPAFIAVLLCCLLSASGARAASTELNPLGIWATQGEDSHVEIEKCGASLCGTIVWLKDPLGDDGKDAVDSNNPDPTLRTQKLVGLPLLSGFEPTDDPGVWKNGRIYNPEDGRTYSCTVTVQDANTLRVRGYVGFSLLGETQIWNRVR
jgi:uncharacterized protein (DUF2147 family)